MDIKNRCLRDMRTGLAIQATLSSIKPLSLNRVNTVHNDYTKLLGQFSELTRPTTKGETVKHGITHKISTKGHPVFARPQRLAPDKLVTAKCEFDDMLKLGVIEPSDSEWSSALHMVITLRAIRFRVCIFWRFVSHKPRTHKKHLKIIFTRLAEYGIIIGTEKCQSGTTELGFLGHHVCSEGISLLHSAVEAIVNFARPEKQRALRRYLGMVNYYHRFIPHCAAKLTLINNLLTAAANEGYTKLSSKSNFDLKWNEGADLAFIESKQIPAIKTLLVHSDH